MRYFGWARIENTGETNAYQQNPTCVSETTFAVHTPPAAAGNSRVPLHDKHVFDTHVLAARRRHRQNGP
jgi:hypothetical protein